MGDGEVLEQQVNSELDRDGSGSNDHEEAAADAELARAAGGNVVKRLPPDFPEVLFKDAPKVKSAGKHMFAAGEGQSLQTVCLLILTCLASCLAAFLLKDVLLPFVFAVFLLFALRPVVDILVGKARIPRVMAILLTMLVAGLLLSGLAFLVSSSVMQLTSGGVDYDKRVSGLVQHILSQKWLARFGMKPAEIINSAVSQFADSFGTGLGSVLNGIFSLVSNVVVVGIYLMFLLFGSSSQPKSEGVWGEIRRSIEYYVAVKSAISLAIGLMTWLILFLLGVPMSLVFGLLAFALNFIPNVGPIVAVLLPLPALMLSPEPSWLVAILTIAIPGLLHFVVGHLLEPNIVGDSLDLDPVVILLSLMLAGVVWGPVGMLLATPMVVVVRILLERVPWAAPVAQVLAGRSPDLEEMSTDQVKAGEGGD